MSEGDRLCNPSLFGSDDGTNSDFYDSRQSPPKAIVDSSPLQPAMDKNKESLKVKLMVRRPITQLVEQGIIPPLKTSPAIHEQCKQLERAKTGDLLKAKIQQRPNREELERRHILEEDECHIDPSLAEKQRMLKKARLADQLNSQIQHRPGPLELIKKNILHTEKPIEKIVKEGLVSFKATSEGLLTRPQHPNSYITFEDDSQSSESDTRNTPPRTDVIEAAAASAGIVTVALTIPTSGGQVVVTSAPILQTKFHTAQLTPYVPPPPPLPTTTVKQDTANLFEELCQSVAGPSPSPGFMPLAHSPLSFGSSASTLSPLSSVASPPHSITPRPTIASPALSLQQSQKSDAPGKDKNRKKNKSKPVSKARPIKFHEYKGPPSAQKISSSSESSATEETSYQLMLEQQNCLLKFLEHLNKNQSIIPATTTGAPAPKAITMTTQQSAVSSSDVSTSSSMPLSAAGTPRPPPMPSPALSVSSSIPPSPATSYAESTCSLSENTRLEKMKVSDLKMHLKRRNLPVSGPKPQLIERLRPYLPFDSMDCTPPSNTEMPASVVSNETNDAPDTTVAMMVNSPRQSMSPEAAVQDHQEQMEVMQQIDSPRPIAMQVQPQTQTTTFVTLSNEDLLREQQRKIDELQRQLQLSQQELQQIRQKQLGQVLPPQQITLITTAPKEILVPQQQQKNQLPQQMIKFQQQPMQQQQPVVSSTIQTKSVPVPAPAPLSQKMVVKQQLEAKIQKQKQAAAAAAQAQAQAQKQAQAHAQSQAQAQTLIRMQKAMATPTHHTVIIPKLDDQKTIIATAPASSIAAAAAAHHHKGQNNVGLMWNDGNQTIFLVGLPPQDNGKKLMNGHHRTTSLPSIVFPITPAEQQIIEAKRQQMQPRIQLELKPQTLPPPPPPPLYEEATKQLCTVKIKEEIVEQPPPQQRNGLILNTTQPSSKRKQHVKSEKLTDVLDILINQGELPESAREPLTPITPLTPGGSSIMTDLSGNLIFSPAPPPTQPAVTVTMDTTLAATAPPPSFQLLNTPAAPPPPPPPPAPTLQSPEQPALLLDNIDMSSSSPMPQMSLTQTQSQSNCHHIDPAKTLDIFLEQQHHQQSSPTLLHHEKSSPVDDRDNKLNHFDEYELLELMSQQLEMDIGGDDNCHTFPDLQSPPQQSHQDTSQQNKQSISPPMRRDMNPSLQPSISELIQQQQQQQQSPSSIINNNNSNSNPMTNGLVHHHQQSHHLNHHHHHHPSQQQHHQQQHHHPMQHHNVNNNPGESSSSNFASSNNNSFSSTPMDVCDDFDNPLASFSFNSQLSPDSNINTPPHPFVDEGGIISAGNGGGGVGSASGPGDGGLHFTSSTTTPSSSSSSSGHNNSILEQMSVCGNNIGGVGVGMGQNQGASMMDNSDSFGDSHLSPINQDNILDLFTIDDYKMAWGEGDFAV